ncbi:MAG: DUF3466 family protein [Psychrobium sp.]|nr:DUF3466 family protein [Psychrobium sp.]
MNKKLQPTLIAAALLACFNANAVVYKIENIDQFYKVNGTIENSRSGYGVLINDNGVALGGASGKFSPLLTEDDAKLLNNSRIDITQVKQTIDTTTVRQAKATPLADNVIFKFDGELIPSFLGVFEEAISQETLKGSVTVQSFSFGINDVDLVVGTTSSPAYAYDDPDQADSNQYKDFQFYAYKFNQRGFIIDDGEIHTFEPAFSTYGGQSGFTAVNDNGLVVGYESVDISPYTEDNIEKYCNGTYKSKIPFEVCTQGFSYLNAKFAAPLFYLQAVSWEYNDGQLSNRKQLGVLAQPIDDKDRLPYNSVALDVNNNNIAVGQSVTFRNGKKEQKNWLLVATVFRNGQIIDLMDHSQDKWARSAATAINNNDIVVGYVAKFMSGVTRAKFFIYDANGNNTDLTFPRDLKTSETDYASLPKDINDNNLVVGSVEIDSAKSGRRTHGFIYDHDKIKFSDLNDLLTCESKGYVKNGNEWQRYQNTANGGDGQQLSYDTKIVIVDANQITDDNTIMATALVTLPRIKTQWLDSDGKVVDVGTKDAIESIVIDNNGKPVFDTDGQGRPITEQITRAVILKPIDGAACSVVEEDSEIYKNERKGANLGFGMILLTMLGLARRRRRHS